MSLNETQIFPGTKQYHPCIGWKSYLLFALVFLCCIINNQRAHGQILEYPEFTETRSILSTPDGGFVLSGRIGQPLVSGTDDAYMAKIDPDGVIQWQNSYGGPDGEDIVSATITSDGHYAFTGYTNSFDVNGTSSDVFVGLVKANGEADWQRSIGGLESDRGNALISTNDGGVVVTGCYDCFGQADLYLMKLDAAGLVEWEFHNYNLGYTAEGFGISPTQDGGFVITGSIDQGNGDLLFLLKIDANGNEVWQQSFGGLGDDVGYGVSEAANGDILVVGASFSFSFTSEDIYLIRTNAAGQYLWHQTFGTAGDGDFGFAVEELPNGEIAIAGSTWSYGNGNGDVYLIKTDAGGNEIWSRTYGTANEETGRSLQLAPDGGFLMAGINRSFDNMGMITGSVGYVVHADAQGLVNENFIRGNVYQDGNGNCAFDSTEPGLEGWIVQLTSTETFYATTDAAGDYEFNIPDGTYDLNLISPTYNWRPCQAAFNAVSISGADTLDFDFPVLTEINSAYLEVDISTAGVTACSNQTYYVNYCNKGPQTADNAQVQIELDPYFTFLTSSINWSSQNGLNYTFDLGNVSSWECGSFEIDVAVSCDAPEGLTHCMNAHALPDSIDLPANPMWDGSSLEIEAECSGDTAIFIITNVGTGPMDGPQKYIVIEDDLVFFTTPIELDLGEQEIVRKVPNGKTCRLEVDQSPGHPGWSMPSASIEGCGEGDNGEISLGYVTQFPEDDGNFFVSIDCQENVNSFAPYDKKGYPKGTQAQHFIDPNTDLEYHIRFQNSLSDTAQTVVIRDTLSPFLDVTTVRPGASSHPYELEIYGDGILKFTFQNINLPPANDNATASVGFVKFRLSQLADNPPGTVIANTSAIYLDYHPANLSPEAFHTIREQVLYEAAADSICLGDLYEGIAYTEMTYLYDTVALANYDSITITQLTINPTFEQTIDTSICDGDVYTIGNYEFETEGTHLAPFSNQFGCDSLYYINLEILPSPVEFVYEEICEGDSLIFGGNIYTSSGKYITINPAANGCDSSIHLTLKTIDPVYTQVDTNMYPGQFYHGILIEIDTTFEEIYVAESTCDSIVTVTVTALITGWPNVPNGPLAIELFPNPTSGDLILNYSLKEAEEVEIRLYHALGNLATMLSPGQLENAGLHNHRFSIADQPPGTYLMWIRSGSNIQIRKVIKWD